MARYLITGSRYRSSAVDRLAVFEVIDLFESGDVLVVGDGRGIDTLAQEIAKDKGIEVDLYKADWNEYGLAAGPRRNAEMVATKPDKVFAFPQGVSKGTYHTVKEAMRRGIQVEIYD